MVRQPLFKHTFGLLFVIFLGNFFSNTLYLYWTVWWADMIMHFLAGFCVAMASVLVWQYYFDKNISFDKAVKIGLYGAFAIGIFWEIFEWYFKVELTSDGMVYVTDTISDLILDVIGGLLGSMYAHYIIFRK